MSCTLRPARNDLDVVRRLRSWFVLGSFRTVVVTEVVALLAANGPIAADALVAKVSEHFHIGRTSGNRAINSDVDAVLHSLVHVLTALDLIDRDWPSWQAGPSARTFLPRATALAHYLDNAE